MKVIAATLIWRVKFVGSLRVAGPSLDLLGTSLEVMGYWELATLEDTEGEENLALSCASPMKADASSSRNDVQRARARQRRN